jgi:hypothetical protein|tara:strand:- start:1775 stop:2119 length:345 start_codon:yes stop_codon:yes gene_type:complete
MDVNLLKLRMKELSHLENPEICTTLFFSEGVKLANPPRVCCKRFELPVPSEDEGVDMTCYPTIDNLQSHNTHVPKFKSKEARQVWVERIQTAVEKAAEEYEGEILPAASADDQS